MTSAATITAMIFRNCVSKEWVIKRYYFCFKKLITSKHVYVRMLGKYLTLILKQMSGLKEYPNLPETHDVEEL